MLRIAICDDDVKFTGSLDILVQQVSQEQGISAETEVFFDGQTLVESIQSGSRYDIIFLDIVMSKVDGITAARRIREIDRRVLLIYISSHENYMKELFEVEPFRFLSKPLNRKKFCRYFREACQRVSNEEVFFQFTFNKEMRKVSLKEIVYFESRNRVIYIYLKDGTVFHFYGKLNDVEKKMADVSQYFLRVHQSYLVNYDYVHKANFGSVVVRFAGREITLKISEDRQKEVRRRLFLDP